MDRLYPFILKKCLINHMPSKGKTVLVHWCRYQNFGDWLNEDLHMKCDANVRFTNPYFADYICIGSILSWFLESPDHCHTSRPLHVFGSGFMMNQQNPDERFYRPMVFHALRGKLSRERCERATKQDLSAVPLGDPGLLISHMYPEITRTASTKVGIITHLADKDYQIAKHLKLRKYECTYIDISRSPREVVGAIAQCGVILSSAMHPMICADVYGIPNCHLKMSNRVAGGRYKFMDYYSAFEHNHYCFKEMSESSMISDEFIDKLLDEYSPFGEEVESISQRLLKAIPKELRCTLA